MSGQGATTSPHEPAQRREPSVARTTIFDVDLETCPKCYGPIEPERLPEARVCLDCVIER